MADGNKTIVKEEKTTWKMCSHAPMEPTTCGTGRFIIFKSLKESDLISTKLFCKVTTLR
jgi:hypothetical protein